METKDVVALPLKRQFRAHRRKLERVRLVHRAQCLHFIIVWASRKGAEVNKKWSVKISMTLSPQLFLS
jgi:hypothetical protein